MNTEKQAFMPATARGHIIALSRWRSRLALIASLVTVSCTMYAIAGYIIQYTRSGWDIYALFHWYTVNSNFLTAFGAAMIIPFAVEGIRKKHFSYPKWVAMFHYAGMVCTTMTMVFSVGIISWYDPALAFSEYNLYLHVLCPVMVIISFFLVEAGFLYTKKDAVLAAVPTFLYEVIYALQVVVIGWENGGWEDMYHLGEFLPFGVSAALITLLVLGISLLIRRLYNGLTRKRREKLLSRLWPKDVSPVEINIEIFGLGRYMGKHADPKFIELPLDLITMIAEQYDLKTEDLMKPYIRGFLDSLRDRR